MKDYKRFLDECACGDRKSIVATAIGGSPWQKCVCRAVPASKSQDGMAAVAAGGEYDGGNLGNTKLTTGLTITVVKRCGRLYELDGS